MLKEAITGSGRLPGLSGKAPTTQLVYELSWQPNTDAVLILKQALTTGNTTSQVCRRLAGDCSAFLAAACAETSPNKKKSLSRAQTGPNWTQPQEALGWPELPSCRHQASMSCPGLQDSVGQKKGGMDGGGRKGQGGERRSTQKGLGTLNSVL